MKVLITGGGGFLGTYIVKELLAQGFEVTNLSRNSYTHLDSLGVSTLCCDLSDKEQVASLDLSPFDAVIHTAAIAGVWGDKNLFEKINYHGAVNILNKSKSSHIKYFIYTSSPSVVFGSDDIINGDEDTPYPNKYYTDYARTKAKAEQEILAASCDEFQSISIRPHLIWGPGDPHLIPRIIEKAKQGRLKMIGDGTNLVDIIYVENAAVAHVQALKALVDGGQIGGNAYFIGQERPENLWGFIDQVLEYSKQEAIQDKISFKLAYYLGFFFESLYKFFGILKPEPPMTRFVAMQLAKSHYFSHKKAQQDFNYQPRVSTEQGLKLTFQSEKVHQ